MKSNYKLIFPLILFLIALAFGCRKPAATTAQTGIFGLHIHTYVDTNSFEPGLGSGEYTQEFPDADGRWINITRANIYVSNVGLHSKTSGNWYTIPGSILLKRLESEIYNIDTVPADTYDNVRFTIGVTSSLNSQSPSSFSTTSGADTVLSANENLMYAGSGKGYYYLYLTGNYDTSSAHNGTKLVPFSYQLYGDTLQVSPASASGSNDFTILPVSSAPGPQLLHIIFDYGKLLKTTPQISNIRGMIRYECSTPDGDC